MIPKAIPVSARLGGELPGVQGGPVVGDDREQAGEGEGDRGGAGGDGCASEALAEGGGCGGAEDDADREGDAGHAGAERGVAQPVLEMQGQHEEEAGGPEEDQGDAQARGGGPGAEHREVDQRGGPAAVASLGEDEDAEQRDRGGQDDDRPGGPA